MSIYSYDDGNSDGNGSSQSSNGDAISYCSTFYCSSSAAPSSSEDESGAIMIPADNHREVFHQEGGGGGGGEIMPVLGLTYLLNLYLVAPFEGALAAASTAMTAAIRNPPLRAYYEPLFTERLTTLYGCLRGAFIFQRSLVMQERDRRLGGGRRGIARVPPHFLLPADNYPVNLLEQMVNFSIMVLDLAAESGRGALPEVDRLEAAIVEMMLHFGRGVTLMWLGGNEVYSSVISADPLAVAIAVYHQYMAAWAWAEAEDEAEAEAIVEMEDTDDEE